MTRQVLRLPGLLGQGRVALGMGQNGRHPLDLQPKKEVVDIGRNLGHGQLHQGMLALAAKGGQGRSRVKGRLAVDLPGQPEPHGMPASRTRATNSSKRS